MTESVGTVFNNNIIVFSIIGIFICPRSFSPFQRYRIIIDRHITILYQHIITNIKVHCIRTRSFYGTGRRSNAKIQQLQKTAFIEMSAPERRIHNSDSLNLSILTVGQINNARTHFFHIGAIRIYRTP